MMAWSTSFSTSQSHYAHGEVNISWAEYFALKSERTWDDRMGIEELGDIKNEVRPALGGACDWNRGVRRSGAGSHGHLGTNWGWPHPRIFEAQNGAKGQVGVLG